MQITYFDEVKYDPRNGQNSYWLAGVAMDHLLVPEVERELQALAKKHFGTDELTIEGEFHSKFIYGRKSNCKGKTVPEVMSIFSDLYDVVRQNGISKVLVRIDVDQLYSEAEKKNPHETAFMFFVERVDNLMRRLKTKTILIGDYDDEQVNATVNDAMHYKRRGTGWVYGQEINNIIDTVHFARSHHCRPLQLADAYAYASAFERKKNEDGYMFKKLCEIIAEKNFTFPTTYKIWPTARS